MTIHNKRVSTVIYLMIEVAARELLPKLRIAREIVKSSQSVVVIASQQVIRHLLSYGTPPGITLQNSCNVRFYNEYALLKRRGFIIVSMDEESLGAIKNPEAYVGERFDSATLELVDRFLFSTKHELALVSACRNISTELCRIVGIPRFDFLTPPLLRLFKEKSLELIATHGKFTLYVSALSCNIHPINLRNGLDGYFDSFAGCPQETERRKEKYRQSKAAFDHTRVVLKDFVSLTGTPVIIRPHPGECWEPWEEYVKTIPEGISLAYPTDSLEPWLLACSSLVHFGCTSALQYFAMGRQPINLSPPGIYEIGLNPFNLVSLRAENVNQLVSYSPDRLPYLNSVHATPVNNPELHRTINYLLDFYGTSNSCSLVASAILDLVPYANKSPVASTINTISHICSSIASEEGFGSRLLGNQLGTQNVIDIMERLNLIENDGTYCRVYEVDGGKALILQDDNI